MAALAFAGVVSWRGAGPLAAPVPSPSGASPMPSPTRTPAPAPAYTPPAPPGTDFSCVVTSARVGCPASGGYDRDLNMGSTQAAYVVQDEWNSTSALQRQQIDANSMSDWRVKANLAAGNTAVLSYPDAQDTVTNTGDKPVPLASYTAITSTFSVTMPSSPGASDDYEAAYDIWLGDSGKTSWTKDQEIMIWTDNHGQTPAGRDTGKTWTDPSTGDRYEIWVNPGSTSVGSAASTLTLVSRTNRASGSVDLLDVFKWLRSAGYTMPNAGIDQIDYGFELCSTSGVTETFAVNRYTLDAAGTGI